MSEYSIQPSGKPDNRYLVHKWEDSGDDAPAVTYIVWIREGKSSCSCASGIHRGRCKHTTMVSEYKALESWRDAYVSLY